MKLRLTWLFVILLPILRAASLMDSKVQELSVEAKVELSFPLIAENEETTAVSPGYLPSVSGALLTIQSRLPEASRRFQHMCHTFMAATALHIKVLCVILIICIVSSFVIFGVIGLSITAGYFHTQTIMHGQTISYYLPMAVM